MGCCLNSTRPITFPVGGPLDPQPDVEAVAVLDVALEMSGLPGKELRRLLDPQVLTRGGIQS